MIRLTWRQHRLQAGSAAVLLAVLAALLVWTGQQMSAYLDTSGLSACLAANGDCGGFTKLFSIRYGGLLGYSAWLNFLPMLVGIFWGAPLLARELEQGTHRLAWTQTVTRRRWLLTKVSLLLGAAVLAGAAFSALLTWWFHPFAQVGVGGYAPMNLNVFDFQGTAPIGYTVYAFALGALAGVLTRRTLPAMAITLAGYLPLRLYVQNLRESFMAPLTVSYPPFGASPRAGLGDWVLRSTIVDNAARELSDAAVVASCPTTGGSKGTVTECLAAHGFQQLDNYQPASRFWTFQGIETGLFVALTALLLLTLWSVTRRTA